MKKIINGRTYNTDTATLLGEYDNGLGTGDFRAISEELYKTKKGNFFLAGEGGAMTRYSSACGDMTGSGEGIIALSEQEARTWVEDHCDADDYISAFGEPDEA